MEACAPPRRRRWLRFASLIFIVAVAAWLAPYTRPRPAAHASASQAESFASLSARGVAWIWPESNGPDRATCCSAYPTAAVLVETLVLRRVQVERMPRTQALVLPSTTRILPVLHLESSPETPDAYAPDQQQAILAAVSRHVDEARDGAGMLQIDFEAPSRQRAAYIALIGRIRDALPPDIRLSVTALAHWCTEPDAWLDRLPVDEVVPMLYRLGPDAMAWRERWLREDPVLARRCHAAALGFATNDPPPRALLARTSRPYWFDESAWSHPSRPREFIDP